MADTSVEGIKKEMRTYLMVFFSLAVLTVVTVGISYLHLSIGPAVALGLLVATIKASLVALFFMHLSHEKTIIYGTLCITGVAFFFCMLIPLFLSL